MKKKWPGKWISVTLACVMAVSLTGCGNGNSAGGDQQEEENDLYTYVPESWKWKDDSDPYMKNLSTVGNKLYFSDREERYYCLDLDMQETEPVIVYEESGANALEDLEKGYESRVEKIFPDAWGGVVVITGRMPSVDSETATEEDWIKQRQESVYSMKKVTEDGEVAFENDITQYVLMDMDYAYLRYALGDAKGNIYLSNGNSYVWIFDKDGQYLNDVKLKENTQIGDYIELGVLGDGRIAVATETNEGRDLNLIAYDGTRKDFSDIYSGLPSNCWGTGITPGPKGGVLLNGNGGLYEYDLTAQTYTEIMKWNDYDINSEYIRFAAALENGNIMAYYDDWNGEEELLFLKKTESMEETRAVLTLGYREWKYQGLSQSLELAIANFNKENDKYKIEAIGYMDPTELNNDIIAGNAPDMFVAEDVNIELFAARGIIEDLNPWLDQSQVVNRGDFFESVLNAYTIDGVLCVIPPVMYITTLVGRTSEVGEEAGWTLDELLAYADEYPDSDIFPYDDRETILYYCIRYNFDSYVNWETGECFFDSEEFKKILELASQYGEDFDSSMSEPEKLANHKALLCCELFASPMDWQKLELAFGEPVTPIGFPTVKSTGVVVNGIDGICISADSEYKEAAWSFIEPMLSEAAGKDIGGMPVNKRAYDSMVEELMEPLYEYDEDGNAVLDEFGNPVEIPCTIGYWEDFCYDMYAVTQKQADATLELIKRVGRSRNYGEELWAIIIEETAPFFEGQKTVDEAAAVIQNRAKIFVAEKL